MPRRVWNSRVGKAFAAAAVLAAGWLAATPAATTSPASAPASKPSARIIELSNAGISLAIGSDLQLQSVSEPFDLLRGVQREGDKAASALTLSAFPVGPKATAESYADDMLNELRNNLAVRYLEARTRTRMTVAGTPAVAQLLSYSYRGAKTTAIRVFFVRELAKDVRVCYVLTVESPAEREGRLLGVLEPVLKSVAFVAAVHPSGAKVLELLEPTTDYRLGYAIRPPVGWHLSTTQGGFMLGQTDYLAGGADMPLATLLVRSELPGTTAAASAKKSYGAARDAAANNDLKLEIVSEGQALLGRHQAYQYVLKQSPQTSVGKAEGPIIIVQRTLARQPQGAGANASGYTLAVIVAGEDSKAALAIADAISAGFDLVEIVKPGTTTQADSRPIM